MTLLTFRQKRAEWLAWLVNDEEHPIYAQIDTMIFEQGIYECFGEPTQTRLFYDAIEKFHFYRNRQAVAEKL